MTAPFYVSITADLFFMASYVPVCCFLIQTINTFRVRTPLSPAYSWDSSNYLWETSDRKTLQDTKLRLERKTAKKINAETWTVTQKQHAIPQII